MCLVGFDDHLYQLVADDILLGKIHKFNAIEPGQHGFRFLDAALLAARQVDLRPVAGNDRL